MQEKVMEFKKFLEQELDAELGKIINSGTISPTSICTMKDAFKLMKLVDEYEENGYSGRRGRSRTTGRYVSRDGGSFGSYGSYDGASNRSYGGSYRGSYDRSGHTQLVSELERMYENAQDERERQMIDEWIRRAEQN